MRRTEYLAVRRKFEPTNIKLVIVAESPPESGKYFYNPNGNVSEPLFHALMKQLGVQPKTKCEDLLEFQKRGCVLVDATYDPVDRCGEKARNDLILGGFGALCRDLKRLLGSYWRKVPLVLIKMNLCRLLDPKLKQTGFNVLNSGRLVYFPSSGQQGKFHQQFPEIVPQELRGPSPG